MLSFLGARAVQGIETVADGVYRRTARIGDTRGWQPSATRNSIRIEVSSSLAQALPNVLRRARRLFDTSAEPDPIVGALGALGEGNPGLRVPGAFDGFEISVRAILGQQISVRAAQTLAGRIAARFGDPLATPFEGLLYTFPGPERIADASIDDIASLGIVGVRANSIRMLASAIVEGNLKLTPGDVEKSQTALRSLPGVGEWTAQYISMRALSYPDAFPHTDLGIMKALDEKNPRRILEIAEAWRPWRSYAAIHLWKSLETQ